MTTVVSSSLRVTSHQLKLSVKLEDVPNEKQRCETPPPQDKVTNNEKVQEESDTKFQELESSELAMEGKSYSGKQLLADVVAQKVRGSDVSAALGEQEKSAASVRCM